MIDRRAFVAGGLCLGLPVTGWAKSQAGSRVAALRSIALPTGFNGVLAYGRRGRIEALRSVGFADMEGGRPMTAATTFRWGSASKWLASVAALRLAERKRLDLDAPIGTYLPDVRRDTGARVTMRHLLSNTSGVPDLLSRRLGAEPELRTSTASAAEIVARSALPRCKRNVAGSAADAVRAAHGIFHGRLLSANSRQQLTRIAWSLETYALGGRVRTIGGEPWAWEAGKVGGYRTLIVHRLKESETIALFATGDEEQALLSGWAEQVIRG